MPVQPPTNTSGRHLALQGASVAAGTPPEPISDFAAAIEARGRPVYGYPVSRFFGLGDKPIHAIGIRLAIKTEDEAAIVAAHGHAAQMAKQVGEAAEAARRDMDLLGDAKTVEALYRVCREVVPAVENPRAGTAEDWKPNATGAAPKPAFPGPKWMRDHLTTDEIACLLNLYLETKRTHGPVPLQLDEDSIDALVILAQNHAYDDLPEAALAPYPREYLTHAFVITAVKLGEAKKSVEALLTERDAIEQRVAALEAELATLRPLTPETPPDEPPGG